MRKGWTKIGEWEYRHDASGWRAVHDVDCWRLFDVRRDLMWPATFGFVGDAMDFAEATALVSPGTSA